MKYTELIPGMWYYGLFHGNPYFMKFSEIKGNEIHSNAYITGGFYYEQNKENTSFCSVKHAIDMRVATLDELTALPESEKLKFKTEHYEIY